MKITRIRLYRQFQPFRDGPYTCSGNRTALGFDSAIVAIDTDKGLTGWGEMAPLGSFYSPAFAAGARAGASEIAPHLIGLDATAPQADALFGRARLRQPQLGRLGDVDGRLIGGEVRMCAGRRLYAVAIAQRALTGADDAALAFLSQHHRTTHPIEPGDATNM